MIRKTFAAAGLLTLDVRLAAGSIAVDAQQTGEAEAEVEVEPLDDAARALVDQVVVERRGDVLALEVPEQRFAAGRGRRFAVRARVPAGTNLRARVAAADLRAAGTLGSCELKSASGDVRLAQVGGPLRVATASGDVTVESVADRADVNTASGDVRVGEVAGVARVHVVSGDVTIGAAAAALDVKSVSGDQRLRSVAASVEAKSVSGEVEIAVRPGLDVWLELRSLSGDTRSELDAAEGPAGRGEVVEIRAKTVSGDIRVSRAAGLAGAAAGAGAEVAG